MKRNPNSPLPSRYRDGAAPSRGAATRPGMTYLREHFHNPGVLPPDTGDNR